MMCSHRFQPKERKRQIVIKFGHTDVMICNIYNCISRKVSHSIMTIGDFHVRITIKAIERGQSTHYVLQGELFFIIVVHQGLS